MKRFILPVVVAVPLLWAHLVSFPQIAALAGTLLLAFLAKAVTTDRAVLALAALFLLQLYVPLCDVFAIEGLALLLLGAVFFAVSIGNHSSNQAGKRECGLCGPHWLTAGVPLALGGGMALALHFSKVDLPGVFVPFNGWMGGAGLSLLWLGAIHWLSTNRGHWGAWFRFSSGVVGVLAVVLLFRLVSIQSEVRALTANSDGESANWERLLERTEKLGWQVLDFSARREALSSMVPGMGWVHIAKGSAKDPVRGTEGPGPFWRLLARGGEAFTEDAALAADDSAVGICMNGEMSEIWILTAQGKLLRISERREVFEVSPSSGAFVHCAQGTRFEKWQRSEVLLLEADGRLLAYDPGQNRTTEICPPPYTERPQIFRRLCIDPETGNPWALDLYGNLYRSPSPKGWEIDKRFAEVSRRGEIDSDVARDITISQRGTVALLTCDGEIWSSSLDSSAIEGPVRETHYWPDHAVGQSIASHVSEHSLVDRYGGVYLSPYPKGRDFESFKGTYLFPRSLPLKEKYIAAGDAVVDHAYLSDRRWIYLLTGRGRILTNHRWSEIWAY